MKADTSFPVAAEAHQRPRLALLVNMISPARVPLYRGLAAHFDLLVLHGGTESNRDTWRHLDELLPGAKVRKAWGWQIRVARRIGGQTFDYRYVHITPGYLWQLLRFRPSVVISIEMGLRTLMALAYGSVFRKPVWVWWGGTLHTERGIGRAKRVVRGIIARRAKHWISYGRSSTEYLSSLGISAERILEVQNAVDERHFLRKSDVVIPLLQRPVVLYVGQFTRRKGVELLLRAAAILQKEGARFSLLLTGSGPEKPAAERLANELGLAHIFFHSSRPPAEMPSVYRSADVFVFPTLEDVWGLVANEAMLSGLPVLCSKYAGCAAELFDPECIFDPQNSQEFVAKLRKAVAGQLPRPDLSRLRPTSQLVAELAAALENSAAEASARSAQTPKSVTGGGAQISPEGALYHAESLRERE
jgi:glycosyltransferase involved in cell wall biosynthesis